jgi:hypothetical protein
MREIGFDENTGREARRQALSGQHLLDSFLHPTRHSPTSLHMAADFSGAATPEVENPGGFGKT